MKHDIDVMAYVGRLLCSIHESKAYITLSQKNFGDITVHGNISAELWRELKAVKPIILAILQTHPDLLPDDWRRMLYRVSVPEAERIDR